MIPDRPNTSGNPVFSVHQTDIIYYGCDLRDYFVHEFFSGSEMGVWPIDTESMREIEFWKLDRFASAGTEAQTLLMALPKRCGDNCENAPDNYALNRSAVGPCELKSS